MRGFCGHWFDRQYHVVHAGGPHVGICRGLVGFWHARQSACLFSFGHIAYKCRLCCRAASIARARGVPVAHHGAAVVVWHHDVCNGCRPDHLFAHDAFNRGPYCLWHGVFLAYGLLCLARCPHADVRMRRRVRCRVADSRACFSLSSRGVSAACRAGHVGDGHAHCLCRLVSRGSSCRAGAALG